MVLMNPERRGFEISLSNDMAAQRYIWPVERALGFLWNRAALAVSIQYAHGASDPHERQKSALLRLGE